jgi:hypothetical protein
MGPEPKGLAERAQEIWSRLYDQTFRQAV